MDGRKLLHDRGLSARAAALLYVGGDERRIDLNDVADAALLAAAEESADGSCVGPACVRVSNVGGEELESLSGWVLVPMICASGEPTQG